MSHDGGVGYRFGLPVVNHNRYLKSKREDRLEITACHESAEWIERHDVRVGMFNLLLRSRIEVDSTRRRSAVPRQARFGSRSAVWDKVSFSGDPA